MNNEFVIVHRNREYMPIEFKNKDGVVIQKFVDKSAFNDGSLVIAKDFKELIDPDGLLCVQKVKGDER